MEDTVIIANEQPLKSRIYGLPFFPIDLIRIRQHSELGKHCGNILEKSGNLYLLALIRVLVRAGNNFLQANLNWFKIPNNVRIPASHRRAL